MKLRKTLQNYLKGNTHIKECELYAVACLTGYKDTIRAYYTNPVLQECEQFIEYLIEKGYITDDLKVIL